jgi:hypothetical protein
MCVMGLDMLFMAGTLRPFVSRVGGFLGLNSFVFPPYTSGATDAHQPELRVRDVLRDIYSFRNIIAHGQEITEKWRMPYDLSTTEGHQINNDSFCRVELMLEASLFLLTSALRRIFTEGLYSDIVDAEKWRLKLNLFEHQYKEAGGLEMPQSSARA